MSTDSGLSPTELERRERNRSKVRRSYYRKLSNLQNLRAQVVVLEDEYERILEQQEQRVVAHADVSLSDAGAVTDSESPPNRQRLLVELARVRKSLYMENEALRSRHMEHVKTQGSLQHLLDVQTSDTLAQESVELQLMFIRRFTIEECLEISRVAYTQINDYIEAQRHTPPRGTTLGWTDRRRFADGILSYCFQKSFPHRKSHELVEATWSLLSSPKKLLAFYSPYLNMQHHVVQQLDDNNLILFRIVDQIDQNVVLKSLYLLTRFETERGVILLSHGLDPTRLEDDFVNFSTIGKREAWQDVFNWVLIENDKDGTDCVLSFGGAVIAEEPSDLFWLTEVLLVVLRWETRVVGPLFVLTP